MTSHPHFEQCSWNTHSHRTVSAETPATSQTHLTSARLPQLCPSYAAAMERSEFTLPFEALSHQLCHSFSFKYFCPTWCAHCCQDPKQQIQTHCQKVNATFIYLFITVLLKRRLKYTSVPLGHWFFSSSSCRWLFAFCHLTELLIIRLKKCWSHFLSVWIPTNPQDQSNSA